MNNPTIFVASPGTGKTTTLISIIEKLLENGTDPKRICYTTFTRAGAHEARDRASERFKLDTQSFPYFDTLHALAYRNTPYMPMLRRNHYKECGRIIGYPMSGFAAGSDYSGMVVAECRGDTLAQLYGLMRSRCETIDEFMPFLQHYNWIDKEVFKYFIDSFENYKKQVKHIDFSDQLTRFVEQNEPLNIDYLFVDEAQDLSKLQWQMVHLLGTAADKSYVAGDDKQSIYVWGGADPEALLNLDGRKEIRDQSYRIPRAVHKVSEEIAKRIRRKCAYRFHPRPEEEGEVRYISGIDDLNLADETWLLLGRNRAFLDQFDKHCFERGYLFSTRSKDNCIDAEAVAAVHYWQKLLQGLHIPCKEAKAVYSYMRGKNRVRHGFKKVLDSQHDDEIVSLQRLREEFGLLTVQNWDTALNALKDQDKIYIRKVIENEGLSSEPRIRINTIHATKGQEADNVVICPDMSLPSFNEYKEGGDDEHRVFYVGVTRAKKRLFLMNPKTDMFYQI
jgi:superfamily I DNA/RNA helicase